MLKITDKLEEKEILVTRGAYENLYRGLGYTIVGEKKEVVVDKTATPKEPTVEEPKEEIVPEKDENEDLMNNILNKKHNRKKN
jgi:hypothetical protein